MGTIIEGLFFIFLIPAAASDRALPILTAPTPTTAPAPAPTQTPILKSRIPCQELVFYLHNILYNGNNLQNATSMIVASPPWGNNTMFTAPYKFGDLVVFDDPITKDTNLTSPPVGRAQGMFLYDQKSMFSSWLGFSFLLNSTEHIGTLNFAGANPSTNKTRDISVIGGTGDFFMARGIATLSTDLVQPKAYFRIRVEVRLYECW